MIETPGHTAGQIAYVFDEDEIAFTGDTLFSLGCGRVFETPLAVMWNSLMKLAALPGETQSIAATNTPKSTPASR